MQVAKSYYKDLIQYRVLSKWSPESQLIECQAFAPSLLNPCPGCLCELQSTHLQFWNFISPNIVGNSSHKDNSLIALINMYQNHHFNHKHNISKSTKQNTKKALNNIPFLQHKKSTSREKVEAC